MAVAPLVLAALLAAQPRLAVLDVRPGIGISADLARGLTDALTHEVRRRNPDVDVLGATEILTMLEVQREKSKLGCQDLGCLAEIGGALGADRVVTAGLNKFGDTYLFTVNLVDVRRARVIRDAEEKLSGTSNQGELLATVERAADKIFPGAAPRPAVPNPDPSRLSLIYDPEIPIANQNFNQQQVAHSIGVELSVPTGRDFRYHLQLSYVNVDGVSGVRLDPLTFGWTYTVVASGDFRLEIEPTVSFVDLVTLFSAYGSPDVAFFVSSGVGVQVNLSYGPLYFFVSPVGLELRYLGIVPQQNGGFDSDGNPAYSENTIGGVDVNYRLRFGIGFQY